MISLLAIIEPSAVDLEAVPDIMWVGLLGGLASVILGVFAATLMDRGE